MPVYNSVIGVLAAAVVGLELWRRSLRNRAARWFHVATFVLFGIVVAATIYGQLAARHMFEAIEADPGNKASGLAHSIAAMMWGYLVAFVAVVVAAVVLGIANWRVRNVPADGPVARLR